MRELDTRAGRKTPGGFRLGRIAGTAVTVDWSLLIVFWLIAASLALGVFPRWHPEWSPLLCWMVSIAAGLLFFASVLLHELSHALVAKEFGLPVPEITLFIFGGLAHVGEEPNSAGAEFLIAIVGPLTSIVLGTVALAAGSWIASAQTPVWNDNPAEALRAVGPLPSLLLWLGPVNLILGLFNLVPGFPLDGGRVLRSIIWALSGDLLKATRAAAAVGQGFAWVLIGAGVAMAVGLQVPLLGAGLVSGLWTILIGWFLNNAALASYQQVLARSLLQGTRVEQLMQFPLETVPLDLPISQLVSERVRHTDQRAFPVVDGDNLVGLVSLEDIHRVPRPRWPDTRVAAVMTPLSRLATLAPDDDARLAMEALAQRDVNQIPVVREGRLLGVVRRQDVMKWLSLRHEPGAS